MAVALLLLFVVKERFRSIMPFFAKLFIVIIDPCVVLCFVQTAQLGFEVVEIAAWPVLFTSLCRLSVRNGEQTSLLVCHN